MSWPLSIEELQQIKSYLYPKIDFAEIMKKYSKRVEEVFSSSFTHKCICPNPAHKMGNERTPSFYFSEEEKTFVCYGCNIYGDVFDIISLIEGMPWHESVRYFANRHNIDPSNVSLKLNGQTKEPIGHYAYRINLALSVELRDFLCYVKNKYPDHYEQERQWVDSKFNEMDSRFSKLISESRENVRAFQGQVLIDLSRRKQSLGITI